MSTRAETAPREAPAPSGRQARRVDALTGVRFLAGFYILLLHFGRPLFARAPAWLEHAREGGYIATSFFLLLSGFVLTFIYGERLAAGALDRRRFWVQRVSRLYPAYALALVLMVPLALVHRWGDVTAAFGNASTFAKSVTGVAHFTLTQAWAPRLVTSWNVPGWCASVELFFYVCFPLVAPPLLARATRRQLWAVLALSFATSLTLSLAYTVLEPDGFRASESSVAFYIDLYKYSPLVRLPEFIFGVALGALFQRRARARLGAAATSALLVGSLGAIGALVLTLHRLPYTVTHNGLFMPLYAPLLWALAAGSGPLHRALGCRPLVTLGNASYALYTLQVPVMCWLVIASGRHWWDAPSVPFTVAFLVLVIAVALAVRRWLERPLQAWLRERLERASARVRLPGFAPRPLGGEARAAVETASAG